MKSNKKHKHHHFSIKTTLTFTVILIFAISITFGATRYFSTTGKTTKLGFENMGKLVTQSANCTIVRSDTKDRKLFGKTIPFTTSKFIYSYDVSVQAGYDFDKIKWTYEKPSSDSNGKINVTLPEVEIISTTVDYDSFKIYDEEDNIFSPITLEEQNESKKEMEKQAQDDAIANGLYENAQSNAENLIKNFLYQEFDSDKYDITFTVK